MNIEAFKQLVEEGYDMNMLYLLSLNSEELKGISNMKIRGWVATCVRKQLLTEEYKITLEGKRLLDVQNGVIQSSTRDVTKDEIKSKFEEWWSIYPATDYFEHKGITFQGTQAKKIYKNSGGKSGNCWDNWRTIINEGKHTPDDIIRATKFHIETAKELSVKRKENQLTYIPNSERYLRVHSFAPYVELSKQQKQINKPIDNTNTFEI